MVENAELMAPCGMNCGICLAYLRDKRTCPGCRGDDTNKSASCVRCIIKNCEKVKATLSGFCYECRTYPCKRLKDLDKRYRTKYGMSMLENLEFIRAHGLSDFVEKENERWRCRKCGGVVCVHRHVCFTCGERSD